MHGSDAGGAGRPLPYLPGIDGLRAVAVLAVVLYHADVSWLPAGFLGVDVFFAISGYLIVSLLLGQHSAGGIDIADFWRRRARRLLPALLLVLAAVTVAALTVARDAAPRLAGDLPASLFYVGNWWQVLRGDSYFETIGRPPLLRHLWSLGVEEQFYVVAPLALSVLLRRRMRRRALAAGAVAAALVSTLLLAALWDPGDTARAYYGTDTRAAPLLLGVALAAVWPAGRLVPAVAPGARAVLDVAGAGALAGLVWIAASADEFGSGLYRGGFLLVAALATIAVAVAAHPASRLGAALAWRPLVWLGTRSYAVYLWHWPVVVLTRPDLDVDVHGNALLVLRIAVTLVLAEASWRWIEQPFRTGRFQRAYRSRPAVERRRLAGAVLGVAVAAWLAVAVVDGPRTDVSLVSAAGGATTLATWPSTTAPTSTTAAPTTAAPSPTVAPSTAAPAPAAAPAPPPGPVVPAGPVLAVGDSVLLASRPAVERASAGMVQVDAEVGRQVWDVLELLERYRAFGAFSQLSALVVHLGTNGPLSPSDFDRLAAAVEGVPRVLVLTVRVPRRWEETSNASVRDGVPRHPSMRLVDWYAASGQPGLLGDDGVHPTPAGADVYARIVLEQLDGLTPLPTTTTTTTATTAPPPPPPESTTTAPPPPPPEPTTTTTTTAPPPTLVP